MEESESQFRTLLAEMLARVNRMVAAESVIFPLGLLLTADGRIEVSVATFDSADQVSALVNAMTDNLSQRALETHAVASCVAFADSEAKKLVAFLENDESFCARVTIPIRADGIDIHGLTIDDGEVRVFSRSGA